LIDSHRGATGGYSLALSPDDLTLSHVVGALEGRPSLTSCEGLSPGHSGHPGECGLEPRCPIRSPLQRLREGLWQLMQRTTLRSLLKPAEGAVAHAPLTVLS
jgi:DNA-binding IscR family transcriptional regulator